MSKTLIFNIAKGIENEQTDISKTRQTRNNASIKGKKGIINFIM
jgi:hypothetical protein